MYLAGMDAHASRLVAIVSKDGVLFEKKRRISVRQPERLVKTIGSEGALGNRDDQGPTGEGIGPWSFLFPMETQRPQNASSCS
jgi:hypothetical protein